MEHLLTIKGVEKQMHSMQLGPIDLTVERGSIVAVVGPNGSGKTTLLNMIMSFIHQDAGEVQLFGQSNVDDDVSVKQKISLVPDSAGGYDDLNAIELANFVSKWYPAWDQQKFTDLVDRFQIDSHTKFAKLSKGMKKSLSLAVAFASEPELLLLDEPTSGLDLFAKRTFMDEVIRFMEREERSVLLTTHILDDVRRLADYIALMCKGKLLGVFEKDSLLNDWKKLWLNRVPERADLIPSVLAVPNNQPIQVITRSLHETEQALAEQNIGIIQTQALELDDILTYLIEVESSSV